MALGVTQQTPGEERHLMIEPELEARIRVLMGGYAAERLVFGKVSTGAENDLKQATKIATKMVAHYGMSKKFGPVYREHETEHPFLGQRIATEGGVSDATVHAIEEEARAVLQKGLDEASALLQKHRAELDRLVEALLENETIEGQELQELLGAPTGAGVEAPGAAAHEGLPAASSPH